MSFFKLFTPISYWLLIGLWLFILVFYLRRIVSRTFESKLFITLLIILAIDAFRTLFESIYFGAWYTSLVGLLPPSVHEYLVRPENVFVPKAINVIAAILVIVIVLRRWIPEEEAEMIREAHHLQSLRAEIRERKLAEEEARESERRLRNVLETIQMVAVSLDTKGRVVFCNDFLLQLTGWQREEIIGKDWFETLGAGEGEVDRVESIFRNAIATGSYPVQFQGELAIKSGDRCLISWNNTIYYDSSGQVVSVTSIGENITESRKKSDALLEKTNALNDILENAADGICVCHNINEWPHVKFTHWNPRMSAITGYTVDEINQLGWYQSMYLDPVQQQKAIERMLNMRVGDDIHAEQWEITDKKGNKKTLSISTTVLKQENGETHVLGMMQDITDRKLAADLLHERQQLYHSLFENNSSVMLLIDHENQRIYDANQSACDYYGYAIKELRNLHLADINSLSETEIAEEISRARSEKKKCFKFRHKLSDGTFRDVEVFSGPVTVSGKSLLCSIVHDVSERREAEQERERLIGELQTSLSEVKTLRNFIPICASCKKIRDDKGYWNQIESYISEHAGVDFSHGVCPECIEKIYGDEDWYKKTSGKTDDSK